MAAFRLGEAGQGIFRRWGAAGVATSMAVRLWLKEIGAAKR